MTFLPDNDNESDVVGVVVVVASLRTFNGLVRDAIVRWFVAVAVAVIANEEEGEAEAEAEVEAEEEGGSTSPIPLIPSSYPLLLFEPAVFGRSYIDAGLKKDFGGLSIPPRLLVEPLLDPRLFPARSPLVPPPQPCLQSASSIFLLFAPMLLPGLPVPILCIETFISESLHPTTRC